MFKGSAARKELKPGGRQLGDGHGCCSLHSKCMVFPKVKYFSKVMGRVLVSYCCVTEFHRFSGFTAPTYSAQFCRWESNTVWLGFLLRCPAADAQGRLEAVGAAH